MIRKNEGLNCVCLASDPCQAGYNAIQRVKFCQKNPTITDPLPAIPEIINLSIRNAEKRLSREDLLFSEAIGIDKIQQKPGNKNDLQHIARKRKVDHMILDHTVQVKRNRFFRERPTIGKGIIWALHPTFGNEVAFKNRITAVLHTQQRIANRIGR